MFSEYDSSGCGLGKRDLFRPTTWTRSIARDHCFLHSPIYQLNNEYGNSYRADTVNLLLLGRTEFWLSLTVTVHSRGPLSG